MIDSLKKNKEVEEKLTGVGVRKTKSVWMAREGSFLLNPAEI